MLEALFESIGINWFQNRRRERTRQRERQRRADSKESAEWLARYEAKTKQEEQKNEFVSLFGFDPELLSEVRYQKEVLLKLAFFAVELEKSSKDMLEYPGVYRSTYNGVSEEYMDALQAIGYFDPKFQQAIPHWSELLKFVKRWSKGEEFRGFHELTKTS